MVEARALCVKASLTMKLNWGGGGGGVNRVVFAKSKKLAFKQLY